MQPTTYAAEADELVGPSLGAGVSDVIAKSCERETDVDLTVRLSV